jgi:alpha-tubulin suppressor-like RCC1 family protein/Ca2+-binding EF-hand superfamily protein
MGQTHTSASYFVDVQMKDNFSAVQALWNEADLEVLLTRLKEMTLNFSLDRVKFAKFLQLSTSYEALVAKWFEEFSHDRASQVVDGLEFLSASIMVSSKVPLFRKIVLLFNLFDLDKTGCIRKDEFTIFLKAVTTGLHRMVSGLPPPATVMELEMLSTEFFSTLSNQMLSQQDMLMWMTEAHYSLHYISVLSSLNAAVFGWGTNHRFQLGLNLEPRVQRVPTPVLNLEGIRISTIASNESHCLFLTADGQVFSTGSGFCGILGNGSIKDQHQPVVIDALKHAKIMDVAVGVRHAVAISEKGQVFTWGAADMGQLGHGSTVDREVHEWAYDPKTGGTFAYVSKPTVVMALFGKKILAKRAACCNFTSVVLTDQGHIYSWGNNTDGQCGQGQKCPDHALIYVDPHMHRTAMQIITVPRRLEAGPVKNTKFKAVSCGGYHTLAIDETSRTWTWGQGLWGKLGHGDQRSMYEPKMVDTLKHHLCIDVAAGESHSLAVCSLYRLTITGNNHDVPQQPFSLLGLPTGRIDYHAKNRSPVNPPNTSLQLHAFACSRLLQIGLPFRHDPDIPLLNPDQYPQEEVQDSIILMDRSLWEGEWLKLATTDFDFNVKMSTSGGAIPARTGINGHIMFPADGKWEPDTDCVDKICVFEVGLRTHATTQAEISKVVLELALECQQGHGLCCLCILPKKVEPFDVEASPASVAESLKTFPFGVVGYEHGMALKKHITKLINMRIAEAPDGLPEDVRDWRECREEFTGRTYYHNVKTNKKRWAPPQIDSNTEASLLIIKEDYFIQRLEALLGYKPKGIIVCQQSWRPDVELVTLPETKFDLEKLDIPIVMVTYEAGEELKQVLANNGEPWVTMEIQPTGGVYSWGNGTFGQLGLSGIENQNFLTRTENTLTNEENFFANRPFYVAHLHEHQVNDVACGAAHTIAVTNQGEVFAWGAADGLGVPLNANKSEVPMFVEQLEGLVKATKTFAGHYHSFVIADMPFKAIV